VSSLEDMLRADHEGPELSFSKSDPERRIGFPAGRYTTPGILLPMLIAVALTLAFFGCLRLIPNTAFAASFTQRGAIPYFIIFACFWGIALLAVKQRKLALQRRALGLRFLPPDDPAFTLTPESADRVLQELFQPVDDPQRFYLTRRIHHALSNLRNIRRIADVAGVLRTQTENDEAQVDSSYTLLRGLLWTLPVLGFIGTVLGLSVALGSFGQVLEGAKEISELRSALQTVTGGLATAFETTLQGLVATVIVHTLMIFVQGREEAFLEDCNDYCQRYVIGRLRLTEGHDTE